MQLKKISRIIIILSIISLSTILFSLQFGNSKIVTYISIISNILQILSFSYWLYENEFSLGKIPEQMNVVYDYVQTDVQSHQVKEKFISRLVNNGIISEAELYNLIKNEDIYIAYPYGEGIVPTLKKITGLAGQPASVLLQQIGFVKMTNNQNILVCLSNSMPKQFRDPERISEYIQREIPTIWSSISEKAIIGLPEKQYPVKFKKWREKTGFKVSYIIAKSPIHDVIINSINNDSFSNEFKKHIWRKIDHKELKQSLHDKKIEIKKVVYSTSIDLLISDLPSEIRKNILKNESNIKEDLQVNSFIDYCTVPLEKIKNTLISNLSMEENVAISYANHIKTESKKCKNLLESLDIYL